MELSYDSKYVCLCGFHVQRGAKFVGLITAVLYAVLAVGAMIHVHKFPWLSVGAFAACLISIASALAILYGQRRREPRLYIPHLITTVIWMFVVLGGIIWQIVEFGSGGHIVLGHNLLSKQEGPRYLAMVVTAILGAALLTCQALFISIVWRAYKYMKDEIRRCMEAQHAPSYTNDAYH